jgi:hypothetical protein
VKLIQAGPSESELRRRQLIEMYVGFLEINSSCSHMFLHSDQDELDERVDRLQKATLKNITSCTGLTKAEQKKQVS